MNLIQQEDKKQEIFSDSDIDTIIPNLPCEGCICLAICKSKTIDLWENGFTYTMSDIVKAITIVNKLTPNCILLSSYVVELYNEYPDGYKEYTISSPKCWITISFLRGKDE